VAQCVVSLAETDQQRAKVLREAGLSLLGQQPALVNLELDPCSMRHLIGAGGSPGGLGVCHDALINGASGYGPDLVVVPNGESRFAIMRQVFRADELAAYCGASGCADPTADVVATGSVSRADAIAFAEWLTRKTSHRYRLPSVAEWRRAMGDEAVQPNGCAERSAVGAQNEFGLSGFVVDSGEWLAEPGTSDVSGSATCDPAGDGSLGMKVGPLKGVRLVREVQ
jgi:hypothetical protein